MKFYELITPELNELFTDFEDRLKDISFSENQLYLYGDEKVLKELVESQYFKQYVEETGIGATFSKGDDRYLGTYIVIA